LKRYIAVAVLLLSSTVAYGAQTANQQVTFTIGASNEISVSGNPGLLEILAPNAGETPEAVQDATTSVSYSTNSSNKKITGELDADMPTGVTLELHVDSPGGAGGLSQGYKVLTIVSKDLVNGISKASVADATLTYILSADITAETIENEPRTVTLTMTAD